MQKRTLYKKQIVCVCAAAAVIAVAAVALLFNKKEEVFRSILVYDVQGSAVIERESVGTMNAAENLYLESGDRVSVASDSSRRIRLFLWKRRGRRQIPKQRYAWSREPLPMRSSIR